MLLAPTFQTPRSLTNIKAIAAFACDLVDHSFGLTLLFVEALAATSLVGELAGAFATLSLLDIVSILNTAHNFVGDIP